MSRIGFVVASNNDEILRSSLLASPDLSADVEISVQRGFGCAGEAYNQGIANTKSEILGFVHQDVFLPCGWMKQFEGAVQWLEKNDPNWGVVGLFGVEKDGTGQGRIYSTGLKRTLGEEFNGARQVETLDEVMLIFRRTSGLRFDEFLPGFHLYGGDICLEAERRGMKNYAISADAIHNTNGIRMLPWAYWKCFLQMRRKWRNRLPVQTPCMPITQWCGPALRYLVRRPLWLLRHGGKIGTRIADPTRIKLHAA